MPLSMLLTDTLSTVTVKVKELSPWQGLTDRLTLVAARLRSAYLVGWFGTRLPVRGICLHVAFVNMHELRHRWLSIGAGRRAAPGRTGPNLTEPLLGMGGALAGMLAAPLNSALLTTMLASLIDNIWVQLGAVLNWLSGGFLLTAVMLMVPVATVAGLPALGLGGHAIEMHNLLGAVAELAAPLRRLWEQLTGPREEVANPLLRQLLVLGDRLAALMAQALGAVAVIVAWLLPLLPAHVDAVIYTMLASQELAGGISFVIHDTVAALALLWTGNSSIPAVLRAVVGILQRLFATLGERLGKWWVDARRVLTARLPTAGLALATWIAGATTFVRRVLVEHPTVMWFRSFLGSAETFAAWRKRTSPPPPPSPPSTPFTLPGPVRGLLLDIGMPPAAPTLPSPGPLPSLVPLDVIPPLADVLRTSGLAGPDPFALTPTQRAALERYRRPPSVFGGQWAELRRRAEAPEAVSPTMALADALGRIHPFVTRSANLVVPQHAGGFLPSLETKLVEIDAAVRRRPAPHPTALLPEPSEIRPVIGRLRVRRAAPEADRAVLEAFVSGLRRQLDLAPYTVPAAV